MELRVRLFRDAVWDVPHPRLSKALPIDVTVGTTMAGIVDAARTQHPDIVRHYRKDAWWQPWLRYPDGRWYRAPGIRRVLASDGELEWEPERGKTPLRELLQSVDEGILDVSIDPLCFWACPGGMGNGISILEWQAFLEFLEYLSAGLGVALPLAALVRSMYGKWKRRGAYPVPWFEFVLRHRSWDAHKLSRWFGVDLAQARAWLLTLGYVESTIDSGLFHFAPDEQSRELLRAIDQKMSGYHGYKGDA
jgi:hypothetical protein